MESITKVKLSDKKILRMTRQVFGKDAELYDIKELTDGFFNTAYMIALKSGYKSVLKVSPKKEVKVMRYEKNIMETEVFFLNKISTIEDIPIPRVLFYDKSKKIIDSDYFFMEFIDGEPLNKIRQTLTVEQYSTISSQLGEYVKKINTIEGEYFGYISQVNKRFSTWSEAFLNMIKELIDDAKDIGVLLPYGNSELYLMISKYEAVLSKVKKPSFVHKDLWEGNIFIDRKTPRIIGIIDCERALYGDALLEPVCGFLLENKSFMNTYIGRVELDRDEYIRTILYKIYLFLLMVIECPYRRYPGENADRWARSKLNEALECLIKIH
ncbi:MAG: phosphotransferase family protein [Bacillota bacterium]